MTAVESATRALARRLGLEQFDAPGNQDMVRLGIAFAALAMLLRAVFWIYTQRYWEDALITCLHAENMASGFGLTHVRPGEAPLHGFTSPLSVLVPLMADLVRVGWGIEFLKLVSIPAGALTVLYVLAIGLHPAVRLPRPLIALGMGYVAMEHHQILWGMAGMETQLSTLILVASVYYAAALRPVALGVSLGLCMLVRPDYAFWTLIVGVYLLFRQPGALRTVVPVALALYLPWVLFTLWHYGSPIPNTVVAKGLGYAHWWEKAPEISFQTVKRHTWMMLAEQIHVLLGPTFAGHGAGMHVFFPRGPESPVANLMFAFATLGGLAIALRRQWALWPLLGCVVAYLLYYIFLVPVVFGWYKVPLVAVLVVLAARGLQEAARLLPDPWGNRALWVFTGAYLALFAGVLPWTFHTERQIQQHVENDVRRAAALWLGERMAADEAVGCEPLGYMGYYSRGNVYDWPGLASRTVVAWSKEHPEQRSLEGMIHGLEPEWLFLRDMEVLYWFKDPAWIRERYHVAAAFLMDPDRAGEIRWIDRNIDTRFRIYRKNPPGARPADAAPWPTVEAYHTREAR